VNVDYLILLFLRLNRVLKTSFTLNLLADKRLLPLIHDSFVLFVDIILVIHGLDTFLVELPEVLTEIG